MIGVSKTVRGLAAAVVAVGLGVGVATPASAGVVIGRKTCPVQSGDCVLPFQAPTSSIQVTVDKAGSSTTVLTWKVTSGGVPVCSGSYRPIDPPQTKTCRVPAGFLRLSTKGVLGATTLTVKTGTAL